MISTLTIQNLKCHGCANTIVNQLLKLTGISEVSVNNDADEVTFSHENDGSFTSAKLKLSDLGYPVIGEANSFGKKAKSYISCAVGRMSKS